jgi:hypothetical protein
MGSLEKIQESVESLKESGLVPNFVGHAHDVIFPSLPPELAQMFQFHNQDLGLEYFGLVFAIWTAFPFFPMRRGTFTKNLRIRGTPIQPRHLQAMLEVLEARKVIGLRYSAHSPWFDAVVLTPGSSPLSINWKLLRGVVSGVELTQGGSPRSKNLVELRGVAPGVKSEVQGEVPGVGLTPGSTRPVVVVGFKNNTNNVTADTVRLAIAGEAWDAMMKIVPGFQAGLLIPHLTTAHAISPGNPEKLLRGAIFYMADHIQRGRKARDPLALLIRHLEAGHVLDFLPDLTKKAPSCAKPEKSKTEVDQELKLAREHRDLLNKYADKTLPEILAEITGHAMWPKHKKTLLQNFEKLLEKNICLGEFRTWAEKELV